jgi:phage FluMu protein Com
MTEINKERTFYRELRCPHCHRLIIKEYIFEGYLHYECPRCEEVTTFRFKHKYDGKINISSSERPPEVEGVASEIK